MNPHRLRFRQNPNENDLSRLSLKRLPGSPGTLLLFLLLAVSSACRPAPAPLEDAATRPELVELKAVIPDVVLDIRYATTDNFTGRAVYPVARCFLVKEAAEALALVQADLKKLGYGLKVYDGYRPLSVQKVFWDILPDPKFVADPAVGSRHNRGYAVDLALVDAAGNDVLMPTPFDDFTEKAGRLCMDLPREALAHRALLESVMTCRGFIPYESEWWHFDFHGFEDKPNLDIPLDQIK
jgi:D-alanyl-D-alanine dipeptidase